MIDHHAFLFKTKEVNKEAVLSTVQSLSIDEVRYLELVTLGINEVREVIEKSYVRPLLGDKQLLVLLVKDITLEAQQALLKLLEEPPKSTTFLFCVPESLFLLSTLLSRFYILTPSTDSVQTESASYQDFLKLSVAERMQLITTRLAAKDHEWIRSLKGGLLESLRRPSHGQSLEVLRILYWVAEHLLTRGASNKQLLEELALTLKSAAQK
jgi:hypothetical protein